MSVILTRILILFVLIFLGFMIGKRKIIHPDVTPDLSNFLVKITLPVTVFLSMIQPFNDKLMKESVEIFFAAIIFHLVTMLLGYLVVALLKIPNEKKGVWIFVIMFTNNGFMGFPLALSVYGNDGMFLMAIANMVSNFLIFSVGMKLLTKYYPVSDSISLKKMVINNINIAVVLGLIFYAFQIPLPEMVTGLLGYISDLTAGLSMIVVGLSLSRINLNTVFKGKDVWIISVIRLLIIPCLVAVILRGVFQDSTSLMPKIIMMMAALPAASSVSILTEQYQTNTELAAKCVFVSTLFSVATIPLMMALAF